MIIPTIPLIYRPPAIYKLVSNKFKKETNPIAPATYPRLRESRDAKLENIEEIKFEIKS